MESKRGFKPSQYMDVSQDHLVAVALSLLLEEGTQPSFENLVAEAYLSFPARFQLEGYPEWPNAHVIGKAWVRCRTDKKWISGSAAQGFALTPLGERIAQKSKKDLSMPVTDVDSRRRGSRQTISSRVVLRLEKSPAFRAYVEKGLDHVSEFEFCDLLYCTLESPPEVLERNLTVIRQEIDGYGRDDLVGFLDKLRDKFRSKMTGKRPRGGLMPKKKEN